MEAFHVGLPVVAYAATAIPATMDGGGVLLAKTAEAMSGATRVTDSATITSPTMMSTAGVILGTAAYMPPEQARGLTSDKRSDVWAFGCVLYEMLTGRRAFAGDDVADTLAAVLRGEPDWAALPKDLPANTRLLLQCCLEKDRRKRIGDMSTARFLIAQPAIVDTAAGVTLRSPAPLWRRAVPFVVTALAAAALAAGIAWAVRPSPTPLKISRFTIPLPEGQVFSNDGRHLVAISPDGGQIVYVANQRLHLRAMPNLQSVPIPGTESRQGVLNPVFSPDGRSIAFWTADDRTIKKMAINGGAPVTVCTAGRPLGISWDATGIVFGQGPEGIMRVAEGGKPETLVRVKEGEIAHGPQMLPDGRHVLFTVATGSSADRWDKAKVVLQSLDSDERRTLIDGGSDARLLPTGDIVYALGGSLLAVPFDVRRLTAGVDPVPILEGVRRGNTPAMNPGVAHFSVSNSGTLIYVPGPVSPAASERELVRVDPKGGIEPLKLPRGRYETARVSPDGKWLAFGTEDTREANVWIYPLSGTSSPRQLTVGGRNRYPIWSADGTRVAFQSDRQGDASIFWQRVDGTGPAEPLTTAEPGTSHIPESWSPKDQGFLFSAVKKGSLGTSLWTFSLQDRKAERFGGVQSAGAILPAAVFSHDGRWVAYVSDETGVTGVYVQPFPATGAKYPISKGRASFPLWSPNEKALIYVDTTTSGAPRLVRVSLATDPTFDFGNPVVVPSGTLETGGGSVPNAPRRFDMAPDGAIFGTIQSDQPSSQPGALRIEVVLNWLEELKQRVPSK
jgi:serine/threonine-protein kinase